MEAKPNVSAADPLTQKRQRAKQACEPCRLRKRRCDGSSPCNMCTQFEYRCYYERHPRKRSKIVEQNAIRDGVLVPDERSPEVSNKREPPSDECDAEDVSNTRSMEANSGIAFTRLLGQRLDPSSGPKMFFTFGWNLGSVPYSVPASRPITDILDLDLMYSLAKLYFINVHPLYGFLDEAWILEQIRLRWERPELVKVSDHLLAGVAALGSWFAEAPIPLVPALVESAKVALEGSSTMLPATFEDVQSWVLRALYLRATDQPHAVWMASCAAMHLAESVGIHQEASSQALHPATGDDYLLDPELRRRTFWVARMLNTWVGFEYGRTRVAIRGITSHLPTPREGDHTAEYIQLYSLSCCLDPDRPSDLPGQWEEFLRQLEAFEVHHDGLELSKANLALCGYRRLRLSNPSLSAEVLNRIINMGLKGLEAALRMAHRGKPWWHVANVPFQVLCVLLAMDVRESLLHVSTAMRTLEQVVEKFNTAALRNALKTACFLVRLSKKRKDEDSNVLAQSLKTDSMSGNMENRDLAASVQPKVELMQQVYGGANANEAKFNMPKTTASSGEWNMDILNSSDFDWDYFLTADMPTFNSFAPDGAI
nr:transcription factor kojr [Quercus suber]POF20071.1 transcription factor kojr [Quercus suber]